MPRIAVIGSSNLDRVARVGRLPGPGETVGGGGYAEVLGGKGANQAVAAARAAAVGTGVGFVACVGDDAAGERMRAAFAADGIDAAGIRVAGGVATGTALILVDDAAENCIAVCPGANAELSPADVEAAAIDASDLVVLQMEVPPAAVAAALKRAAAAGVDTLLNFAPADPAALPLSDRIGTLVVNETEAGSLLGEASPAGPEAALSAAERLRARGPRRVVVTLGAAGAVAVDADGGRHAVPAVAASPIDTTGAGDTFCGAVAVALVEGRPLPAAMRFAAAAAAIATEGAGAQPAIPRRAAIVARLAG